jgi:arabinogalactan oligomer / maltooligosaccharide transport system permease protein
MRKLSWREQMLTQLGLLVLGVFVLLPVWGMAYLAFDGGVKGWPISLRLWPETFTLAIFQNVWQQPAQSLTFLGALKNSLIVCLSSTALALVCGASMAYAFARFRFPGRRVGLFTLLVGALLPPVALLTPLFIILTAIQIRATLLGLIVVYTAFALPFGIWNMRAAFQSVPNELEESAFLDGASHWTAFWRITLPLALPSIAVTALMAFLIGYSEFALGWLFVDKSDNVTLGMALWGLFNNNLISWSRLAAAATLMTVPVVILFLALQRFLMTGLWTGTVDD